MDLAPLYGLRLRTDRLELRWPDEEELIELAQLAQTGVHDPDEMPFVVPWTDGIGAPGFVQRFVQFHLGKRRDWAPEHWSLELAVWCADEPIGVQSMESKAFDETRVVKTGSWLAQRFHGQGFGTEMRAAVLELAFHGLGAHAALSSVLDGAEASLHVSQKLGYVDDGEEWVQVRGQPRRDRRLRLTRDAWIDRERISVRISGLERCFPLFGLNGPPEPWVPSC
jgi:RimJ/RimL family protein N-acetyltransferase